jgi:hypothetical protein
MHVRQCLRRHWDVRSLTTSVVEMPGKGDSAKRRAGGLKMKTSIKLRYVDGVRKLETTPHRTVDHTRC